MRHLAMTGIVTASWISLIISGSDIRATPPCTRMSAGTRSSAMTATAPASSAIFACSALTTSMMTPPLSISARPLFTRIVPNSAMKRVYLATEAALDAVEVILHRRGRPDHDGIAVHPHDVVDPLLVERRRLVLDGSLRRLDVVVGGEGDPHRVAAVRGLRLEAAVRGERGDQA